MVEEDDSERSAAAHGAHYGRLAGGKARLNVAGRPAQIGRQSSERLEWDLGAIARNSRFGSRLLHRPARHMNGALQSALAEACGSALSSQGDVDARAMGGASHSDCHGSDCHGSRDVMVCVHETRLTTCLHRHSHTRGCPLGRRRSSPHRPGRHNSRATPTR